MLIRIGIGEGNFRHVNGIKIIQRTEVFSIGNENVFYCEIKFVYMNKYFIFNVYLGIDFIFKFWENKMYKRQK